MNHPLQSAGIRYWIERPWLVIGFASVLTGLVLLAVLMPFLGLIGGDVLQEGDVSPQDILASYTLTYNSQALTERQRDQAASAIAPVYTPVDVNIARRQFERLRAALAYINSVRADLYASPEQKLIDLTVLADIRLTNDSAAQILSLTDARWQTVQQEAIVVLEQVMRNTIRDDHLEETLRSVPALVSLSLTKEQADLVAEIVTAFVVPNSVYNDDLTQAAIQQARQSVPPVQRTYITGETIVQRGQLITPAILEALQEYGLAQPKQRWQDIVSGMILTLLVLAYFSVYFWRSPRLFQSVRGPYIFGGLFLVFLYGARLIVPGHTVLPYLYPTMAFGLTAAALFGSELALVSILPLAILVSYGLPNALDLTLFTVLSSMLGVLALRRGQRITSFFWSGAVIAVSGMLVLVLYRLPEPTTDWIGLLTLSGAALFNGVASAGISVLLQFFIAQPLGMTTALQLIELSRPDHALLQFVLRNAPGTYQHSLQVANLAEQAAESIDADPLLTRVGTLYHDVGKALNPFFFIENQMAGNINSHDDLNPSVAAATIIRHVTNGEELAKRYRLPERLRDFIREHHGTMLTSYQYVRAVQAAGGDESLVDPEQFRYPGPRPSSRETALVMLADGCEARMRAERPKDESELRALIQNAVNTRLQMGELSDTNLTLKDLEAIVDSFTATLRGVYHPRIEYPKLQSETSAEPRNDPKQEEE